MNSVGIIWVDFLWSKNWSFAMLIKEYSRQLNLKPHWKEYFNDFFFKINLFMSLLYGSRLWKVLLKSPKEKLANFFQYVIRCLSQRFKSKLIHLQIGRVTVFSLSEFSWHLIWIPFRILPFSKEKLIHIVIAYQSSFMNLEGTKEGEYHLFTSHESEISTSRWKVS